MRILSTCFSGARGMLLVTTSSLMGESTIRSMAGPTVQRVQHRHRLPCPPISTRAPPAGWFLPYRSYHHKDSPLPLTSPIYSYPAHCWPSCQLWPRTQLVVKFLARVTLPGQDTIQYISNEALIGKISDKKGMLKRLSTEYQKPCIELHADPWSAPPSAPAGL